MAVAVADVAGAGVRKASSPCKIRSMGLQVPSLFLNSIPICVTLYDAGGDKLGQVVVA